MNLILLVGIFAGTLLGYTIGVFTDRYLLPIGDALLQAFVNKKNFQAAEVSRDMTRVEKEINDIRLEMQPTETHAIGYQFEPSVEFVDEDDLEDKQIGFRREKIK